MSDTHHQAPHIPGFDEFELVGRGGFATVWRAHQISVDRQVALKILDVRPGEQAAGIFERERKAAARLGDHPNIVALFDAHLDATPPYLVIPFYSGGELHGPLSPGRAVASAIKVAGALASAHALNVIHNDVKPQNILVDGFGEPAVSDFGISKLIGDSQLGADVGLSPGYSAPEVLSLHGTVAESDVFSLGRVLMHWLTGKHPDEVEIGELPRELVDLVGDATHPEADRRPTACEFGHRLQSVERGWGIDITPMVLHDRVRGARTGDSTILLADLKPRPEPSPDPAPLPSPPPERRTRRRMRLVGAAALALVIAGVALYLGLRDPSPDGPEAGEPSAIASTTVETGPAVTPTSAITGLSTAGPSGASDTSQAQALGPGSTAAIPEPILAGNLTFASDRAGTSALFDLDLETRQVEEIADVPDGAQAPSRSADGSVLAFLAPSDGGSAVMVSTVSGTRVVSDAGSDTPAVSPDGRWVAFASGPSGARDVIILELAGAGSGSPVAASSSNEGQPAFSPDGLRLAISSNRSGAGDLFVVDLASSAVTQVTDGPDEDGEPAWSPDGTSLVFARRTNTDSEVMTVDIATKAVKRVTSSGTADVAPVYVTANHVVFSSDRTDDFELWLVDLLTGDLTQLTDSAGLDIDATFA